MPVKTISELLVNYAEKPDTKTAKKALSKIESEIKAISKDCMQAQKTLDRGMVSLSKGKKPEVTHENMKKSIDSKKAELTVLQNQLALLSKHSKAKKLEKKVLETLQQVEKADSSQVVLASAHDTGLEDVYVLKGEIGGLLAEASKDKKNAGKLLTKAVMKYQKVEQSKTGKSPEVQKRIAVEQKALLIQMVAVGKKVLPLSKSDRKFLEKHEQARTKTYTPKQGARMQEIILKLSLAQGYFSEKSFGRDKTTDSNVPVSRDESTVRIWMADLNIIVREDFSTKFDKVSPELTFHSSNFYQNAKANEEGYKDNSLLKSEVMPNPSNSAKAASGGEKLAPVGQRTRKSISTVKVPSKEEKGIRVKVSTFQEMRHKKLAQTAKQVEKKGFQCLQALAFLEKTERTMRTAHYIPDEALEQLEEVGALITETEQELADLQETIASKGSSVLATRIDHSIIQNRNLLATLQEKKDSISVFANKDYQEAVQSQLVIMDAVNFAIKDEKEAGYKLHTAYTELEKLESASKGLPEDSKLKLEVELIHSRMSEYVKAAKIEGKLDLTSNKSSLVKNLLKSKDKKVKKMMKSENFDKRIGSILSKKMVDVVFREIDSSLDTVELIAQKQQQAADVAEIRSILTKIKGLDPERLQRILGQENMNSIFNQFDKKFPEEKGAQAGLTTINAKLTAQSQGKGAPITRSDCVEALKDIETLNNAGIFDFKVNKSTLTSTNEGKNPAYEQEIIVSTHGILSSLLDSKAGEKALTVNNEENNQRISSAMERINISLPEMGKNLKGMQTKAKTTAQKVTFQKALLQTDKVAIKERVLSTTPKIIVDRPSADEIDKIKIINEDDQKIKIFNMQLKEIYTSESSYLAQLKKLTEKTWGDKVKVNFIVHMENQGLITKTESILLQNHNEEIIANSEKVINDLQVCSPNSTASIQVKLQTATRVLSADSFNTILDGLAKGAIKKDATNEIIANVMAKKTGKKLLDEFKKSNQGHSIEAVFILPAQRAPRYGLYLGEFTKISDSNEIQGKEELQKGVKASLEQLKRVNV